MEEEVIDISLKSKDEESRRKQLSLEEFLENNKLTLVVLVLGIILLGAGVLGFKFLKFTSNQPKVEILPARNASNLPASAMRWQAGLACVAGGGSENCDIRTIMVEAAGEVQKPGVFKLEAGSRVNDLLISAGGLSAGADRDWVEKNINMAAQLSDGAKIYIPKVGGQNEEVLSIKRGGDKININTATEKELDTLWGIGPATAQKIISGRPYQKIEELLNKKIVKSNVWAEIKDKITIY